MCGIIGVLSSEGFKGAAVRRKVFVQSLYSDALRGFDSTGIILAGGSKQIDHTQYKRALPAADFLTTRRAADLLKDIDDFSFAIGHNRYATQGGVSDETAHPFEFDNVLGVHNGTLKSTVGLDGHKDLAVDSEILYKSFDARGHEEVIPKLNGAFALVWYDKAMKELKLVRNEERPLFIAGVKGEDTIYLASEKEMLTWILHRNSVNVEYIRDIGVGKVLTFSTKDVKDFTELDIELKEDYPIYSGYKKGGGHWYDPKNQPSSPPKTLAKVTPKKDSTKLSSHTKDLYKKIGISHKSKITFKLTEVLFNVCEVKGKKRGTIRGTFGEDIGVSAYLADSALYKNEVGNTYTGSVINVYHRGDPKKEDIQLILGIDSVEPTVLDEGPLNFYGRRGEVVDSVEWDQLTGAGCGICGSSIMDDDSGKIGWMSGEDGSPICIECLEEFEWGSCIPPIVKL